MRFELDRLPEYTDEAILQETRRVAGLSVPAPLTTLEFNRYAKVASCTVARRFGSWQEALKKAGVELSKFGRRYSEYEYFENILAVWTHHGRQPRRREMNMHPSLISGQSYKRKFGTWTKALIAFVQHMDEPASASHEDPAIGPESQSEPADRNLRGKTSNSTGPRAISLSLRYLILKRDSFKCVLCGRAPATHPGCELHVDHILPFSKGGATLPENLRTTCSTCNLGKGDKIE